MQMTSTSWHWCKILRCTLNIRVANIRSTANIFSADWPVMLFAALLPPLENAEFVPLESPVTKVLETWRRAVRKKDNAGILSFPVLSNICQKPEQTEHSIPKLIRPFPWLSQALKVELQDSCCLLSSHNLLLPFNGNHQLNQGNSPYKYKKYLPSLEYFAYPSCIGISMSASWLGSKSGASQSCISPT